MPTRRNSAYPSQKSVHLWQGLLSLTILDPFPNWKGRQPHPTDPRPTNVTGHNGPKVFQQNLTAHDEGRSALEQQVLDVPKRQWEPCVHLWTPQRTQAVFPEMMSA